jgi:hypothetical protein
MTVLNIGSRVKSKKEKLWALSSINGSKHKLFSIRKLECEVCNQPLPKIVYINDKKYDLIEFQRPDSPYIILESVCREKRVSKGLYIVHSTTTEEPSKLVIILLIT